MENATSFIWQVFNQTEDDERYVPEVVSLYISNFSGYGLEMGDTINANYGAPPGLIEGIADYVMVKSGYYQKEWYKKPGSGNKWDEGYDVTEMFLEYCDNLTEGFTAKLNKMMRYYYNDSYFEQLLGKPLDQLWTEYKAMHGNINDTTSDQASSTRVIAELNY
ncbi:basic secretory protease [Phtheirospermum japonicum]|uniref:Basic secretory protease n=1 Tax=Phtheirospermum japonicum TaxID=374723 RepID=A0A830CQG3_9LAMI|nr:basic secretory protease [Phtheirospermum japonicum]